MTEMIFGAAEQFKHEASLDHEISSPPFTPVPACYIGKIANGEKTAAPALHLIAYKMSRGGNWVLNIIDVRKVFGMGWRAFQHAIAHLKRAGVLHRLQPNHRDFARESLAPRASTHWVRIDDRVIVSQPSAVVAFILAANVSPTARTPAEIAAKIGIKSRDTTRKTLSECERIGAVETFKDAAGKVWVCRPGDAPKNGVAKNGVAKNGVAKNGVAQRNKKEDQRTREKDKKTGNAYVAADAAACPDWDLLSLHDWRDHSKIQALVEHGHVDLRIKVPTVSASHIDALLAHHGASAPAHLLSPQGVHQICALAAVACTCDEVYVDFETALDGVCNRLASEIIRGASIRSLAFVALPILNAAYNGGDWATHYQSHRLGDTQRNWLAWAEGTLIPALNHAGVPTDDHALTSTRELEALARLFRLHGQQHIKAACRVANIEPGKQVCGWRFLISFMWSNAGSASAR